MLLWFLVGLLWLLVGLISWLLFWFFFLQVRSTEACFCVQLLNVNFISLIIFTGEEHRGLPGKTCSSEEAEGKVGILYCDDCFLGGIICWHLSLFRINPDHQRTTPTSKQKFREQLRPKEAGPEGLASLAKRFSKRILRSTWSEAGWSWVLTSWLWDNVGNCKHCDRIKYQFCIQNIPLTSY